MAEARITIGVARETAPGERRVALTPETTRKLTGRAPSDRYFRTVTKLGERIAAGGCESLAGRDAAGGEVPEEIVVADRPE